MACRPGGKSEASPRWPAAPPLGRISSILHHDTQKKKKKDGKVFLNTQILPLPPQKHAKVSKVMILAQKVETLFQRIFLLKTPYTRLPQGLRGQREAWPLTLTDICSVQSEQRCLTQTGKDTHCDWTSYMEWADWFSSIT